MSGKGRLKRYMESIDEELDGHGSTKMSGSTLKRRYLLVNV